MESSSCDKMGYENTRVPIITVTWSRQLCATVAVGANAFDGCVAPSVLPGCCCRRPYQNYIILKRAAFLSIRSNQGHPGRCD